MPNPKTPEPKTEPKEPVTETVSKSDYEALKEQHAAELQSMTAQIDDLTGKFSEVKGRLSEFEQNKAAANLNEDAKTFAEIMANAGEEEKTNFKNALTAADGSSVLSSLTKHIQETKVAPIQASLDENIALIAEKDAKINELMIKMPALSAAATYAADHDTAREMVAARISTWFKLDPTAAKSNANGLVPTEHCPHGGIDPDTGEIFADMNAAAKYLTANDTFLGKQSNAPKRGGNSETVGNSNANDAQLRAAQKNGDVEAGADAILDRIMGKHQPQGDNAA